MYYIYIIIYSPLPALFIRVMHTSLLSKYYISNYVYIIYIKYDKLYPSWTSKWNNSKDIMPFMTSLKDIVFVTYTFHTSATFRSFSSRAHFIYNVLYISLHFIRFRHVHISYTIFLYNLSIIYYQRNALIIYHIIIRYIANVA